MPRSPSNPIIFANDSFLALTGYERRRVLGKSFNFFLAHAADAEGQAAIDAEFSGKSGLRMRAEVSHEKMASRSGSGCS